MKKLLAVCSKSAAIMVVLCFGVTGNVHAEVFTQPAADIPVGPADTNNETSRGLTAILDNCALAYSQLSHFSSRGTYYSITKLAGTDPTHAQAAVTINYERPDRIAIHSKSDSDNLQASFVADGDKVTQISAASSQYSVMPQPDSLGAFSDPYRPGEFYQEKSGAMGISILGPMLMTDDAYAILHEDITQYVYEGEEALDGRQCHRVRFVQDDPDVIVNLWIDRENWLIPKISFIASYDEGLNRVESFDEGAIANMMIMVVDEFSTSPDSIDPAAFRAEIPSGYEEFPVAAAVRPQAEKRGSLWESMVSAAAEISPEETTWSLTQITGQTEMEISLFAELSDPVLEFDSVVNGTSGTLLAIARKNGQVTLHSADGRIVETLNLNGPISMFASLHTETSGVLFTVVNDTYSTMSAYDREGREVWEYSHPTAAISGIITSKPTTATEEAVYVTMAGDYGLRKLNAGGAVLFANSRLKNTAGLKPAEAGIDRVLTRSGTNTYILDKNLKEFARFSGDNELPSLRWDDQEAAYPIVAVAVSTDEDVMLQRISPAGEIAWTTMLAPKAENVESSALFWANIRLKGSIVRCLAAMLSDGQVVLVTTDGTVVYRGEISANDALIKRNSNSVVRNMFVADLNGDGVDEIYIKMDNLVLKLETP